MTSIALPRPISYRIEPKLLIGLALAALIAAAAPFDKAFAIASLGQPWLRAALIVVLALTGLTFARRVGLRVEPPLDHASPLTPILAAVAVAVWCAGVDWLFRRHLGSSYLQMFHKTSLSARLLGFAARAFNENILYRLFLGSALCWGFGQVWRAADGRPAPRGFCAGFAVSQALNDGLKVSSPGPVGALRRLHDTLRYFAPGMVWSALYARRGFQANEIASTSVHVVFQPLAGLLLAS